jgi:hypothetical protein
MPQGNASDNRDEAEYDREYDHRLHDPYFLKNVTSWTTSAIVVSRLEYYIGGRGSLDDRRK